MKTNPVSYDLTTGGVKTIQQPISITWGFYSFSICCDLSTLSPGQRSEE